MVPLVLNLVILLRLFDFFVSDLGYLVNFFGSYLITSSEGLVLSWFRPLFGVSQKTSPAYCILKFVVSINRSGSIYIIVINCHVCNPYLQVTSTLVGIPTIGADEQRTINVNLKWISDVTHNQSSFSIGVHREEVQLAFREGNLFAKYCRCCVRKFIWLGILKIAFIT